MRTIYVTMALGFATLILVSLWVGLSGVNIAADTTAGNVEVGTGN